jgi:uncharacterized protein YndB with AHSA1/START domain
MAAYSFVTHWFIPASQDRVWAALKATDRYHEWWPSFIGYRSLTEGDVRVGSRAEQVVRGALPYKLQYETTLTKMDPPHEAAYDAHGDLKGRGRFVLVPRQDGAGTEVTFYWDVQTTGRAMNILAPLLRPLFAWNHNWVMAGGERGLTKWLRSREAAAHTGSAHS